MSTRTIKHTYGSRKKQTNSSLALPTPSPSTSPPPSTPPTARQSKRGFSELIGDDVPLFSPSKRTKTLFNTLTSTSRTRAKALPKPPAKVGKKPLTQLHFTIDQPTLRRCPLCDLSYTKGASADEELHRAHCQRVRQDMIWGREEEKDRMRGSETVVAEVENNIRLKGNKKTGRILCISADISGKVGTKLSALYKIVNTSLSSPDLSPSVLQSSKVYLFLLPHETQIYRERIVGCVIAQRISTAMAVIPNPAPNAVLVDSETGLFCSPIPLPTPMGIPRLYVAPSHRRLGVARLLLDAAAATFIHGCPLDPKTGQIAFSQPTGMGQKVMNEWGKGGIRVYEED